MKENFDINSPEACEQRRKDLWIILAPELVKEGWCPIHDVHCMGSPDHEMREYWKKRGQ